MPNTIPWEQRKLGELATFSKGCGYSKSDLRDSGYPIILYGRLYTQYETEITEVDTFIENDINAIKSYGNEVIVPASGETSEEITRASAVGKKGIVIGGDLNIIRPKQGISTVFLALSISNGDLQKNLSKKAQGKSVVHIRNDDLKEVILKYPSYEEQTQIGNFFKQLDDTIALHQRELEKFKILKTSYLENIFLGKVSLFTAKNTITWEQRKLGEVVNVLDNLRIPIAASQRLEGVTPYYGANGIQGYIDGFTHDGEFVLVAEDGANDLINYPVQYVSGKVWINNHAHVLQGIKNVANNLFLVYRIKSMDMTKYLVGGGRTKLNASVMKDIELHLPNYAEQTQIGNFFKQLDDTIALHQKELTKYQQIKASCLEKMFVE